MATAFLQGEIDQSLNGGQRLGLSGGQQEPGTGRRGVGDGADQFRIIGQALAPVGFGPAPVKNKFAIGMGFQVQGRRTQQSPVVIPADDMPGNPADRFANTTVALQGAQEFVAEKGILVGNQGVPLGSGEVAETFKAFEAHDPEIGEGERERGFGTQNGASVQRRAINTF